MLVYDMLIYWNDVDRKFIPGLAESWEVSPDALTTTFHLRKGVQFHDGWGEFTSEEVKYNFEMQASPKSIGKTSQCRRIASMDTPDPYTLVVHMKTPFSTFFMEFSLGVSGVCQGFVPRKYVETVGEEVAGQKPVGTGPYKLVESKVGDYYKFEALESHWRVVPEFKTLTLRAAPEVSTTIAMLKNKEVDLANVPAEQLEGLKAAGLATEVTPYGGGILVVGLGGMVISADKRYDPAYHNKDPWTDPKVRKAMALAIDRQAICNAIFAGAAFPAGVPLFTEDMDTYQYPYDPSAARQLLKDVGYPEGFSFEAISYIYPGVPESPRVMEALASYWQQIGLAPKITVIDYAAHNAKNRVPCKTAGQVFLVRVSPGADMMSRTEIYLMPNGSTVLFEDEVSYAIYKEGSAMVNADERAAYVDKLNKYYFDNAGPIPILRAGFCFAWNGDKISPWPHSALSTPYNLEYVRHNPPLNTFRLFTPMPGR
jgi:peptide/nickel transport system substrate-binding protein